MLQIKNSSCLATNATNLLEDLNATINCPSVEDFKSRINDILHDASINHLSADYVAGKIDDIARENPDFAKQYGLDNFSKIKRGVQKALEFGGGGRPLVMPKASDFDLFLLGVRIEKANPTRELTKEELQKLNDDTKKILVIYGAIASGTIAAASAPYWAPTLTAACSGGYAEAMIFASTTRGQQIVKDAKNLVECIGSMIEESPPPDTVKGVECYLAKYFYDKVKKLQNQQIRILKLLVRLLFIQLFFLSLVVSS